MRGERIKPGGKTSRPEAKPALKVTKGCSTGTAQMCACTNAMARLACLRFGVYSMKHPCFLWGKGRRTILGSCSGPSLRLSVFVCMLFEVPSFTLGAGFQLFDSASACPKRSVIAIFCPSVQTKFFQPGVQFIQLDP